MPVLWLLIGVLLVVKTASACELSFAAEAEFPPHLMQQGEEWTGQSVVLLKRLAEKTGCRLRYVDSPWLRSLQQLKSGELAVVSQLTRTQSREQDFVFIGPHHTERIWLIGDPTKLLPIQSLQQLAGQLDYGRIAELNGAYYGEQFEQLKRQPEFARQLVSISSIQDKLALLRANRVNAILEDETVLQYWQDKGYQDAVRYQKLLLIYQSPVYFGFSKKALSQAQLQKLQQAWQQMVQDGEVSRIQAMRW
ncbi:transporter substrate-binding domain-containing protein [Rheinheimera sp.]|uniref:substrate-binding periplasmic protein n=1 Tax=Rheinheimera sp. TaxID=1869214 RepID=UPI00307F7472